MGKEQVLADIYESVMDKEGKDLNYFQIILSMYVIQNTYKRIDSSAPIYFIDYNNSSYRFAYIYLYAVCHTAAVIEHIRILKEDKLFTFLEMMKFGDDLNVCSLGGGPGCDVIGFLCGLDQTWSSFVFSTHKNIRCTVLDMCSGWSVSLNHVLKAFLESNLGKRYESRVNCKFVQADLCSSLNFETVSAIKDADIITMIKYVSVVSYYYRSKSDYLKAIFELMKAGSFLFFLDNKTGGFYEMVSEIAEKNNLVLLFQRDTFYRPGEIMKFSKYNYGDTLNSTSVKFAVWEKKY